MSGNLYMALAVFAFYEATERRVTTEELNGLMAEALPKSIPVVSAVLDMNRPRTQNMLRTRFEKYKALSDKKLDNGEWGNSWRVELNPHGRETGVAFDLVGCPLADFANSHGYDDIMPLLCSFDYATASLMRARLIREHTIAEGGAYCDYWYVGDQEDGREAVSVRYRLAERAVALTGMRKLFGLPKEQLFSAAAKFNRERGFQFPRRKKYHYADVEVADGHCLKITRDGTNQRKALLFLFGGGMMIGPDDGDVQQAEKLGFSSGRDVWFPYYPLCADGYNMEDASRMVCQVYERMLEEYAPENIDFVGFSSGGCLCITACLYALRREQPLPMPRQILAVSPGSVPHCEEEWREMQRLGKLDLLVDPQYMQTMPDVLSGGREMEDYLLHPSAADFTGMPPIHFWFGSHEVLCAEAPYYEAACKGAGVPYTMTVGEGLCHCYPMSDLYPEGKRAQADMIALLGGEADGKTVREQNAETHSSAAVRRAAVIAGALGGAGVLLAVLTRRGGKTVPHGRK